MNNNRNRSNYRGAANSRQPSYRSDARQPVGANDNRRTMLLVIALCAAVVALLIFCVSLQKCACGESDPEQSAPPVATQPESQTVRVTFPEGYNVLQIGARLEENGVCSASDLYDTMNTVDFSQDFTFLPPFSELSDRTYYLEGYLFPDTYDFYVGEGAQSVIKRFLRNFDARIGDDLRSAVATTGDFYGVTLSLDDIIIMASIVEREISVPSEMNGVAAVFYNRVKYPGGTVNGSATGGFFQSDATKFYPYVMDTAPSGFVSDYNTFNVKGLPKGPICCPSYDAIRASINPDHDNDAFFFYTDINKKVYYAVTLSEHQQNYKYCVDNGLNPW